MTSPVNIDRPLQYHTLTDLEQSTFLNKMSDDKISGYNSYEELCKW